MQPLSRLFDAGWSEGMVGRPLTLDAVCHENKKKENAASSWKKATMYISSIGIDIHFMKNILTPDRSFLVPFGLTTDRVVFLRSSQRGLLRLENSRSMITYCGAARSPSRVLLHQCASGLAQRQPHLASLVLVWIIHC